MAHHGIDSAAIEVKLRKPLSLQIRRLLGSSQASPSPVGRRLILGFRAGEIPGASITPSGITWPLGRRRAFRGRVAPKYAFVNRIHRIARPLGASLMGES